MGVKMSFWQEHDLTSKIETILGKFHPNIAGKDFGKPYVSAYQIAFEFAREYSGIMQLSGYEVGGKDTDDRNSLALFIARELSTRIRTNQVTSIDCVFLAYKDIEALNYSYMGTTMVSNIGETAFDLALFRMKT